MSASYEYERIGRHGHQLNTSERSHEAIGSNPLRELAIELIARF